MSAAKNANKQSLGKKGRRKFTQPKSQDVLLALTTFTGNLCNRCL